MITKSIAVLTRDAAMARACVWDMQTLRTNVHAATAAAVEDRVTQEWPTVNATLAALEKL